MDSAAKRRCAQVNGHFRRPAQQGEEEAVGYTAGMVHFQFRVGITVAYLLCLYATLGVVRPLAEYLREKSLLRLTVLALFTLTFPAILCWRAAVVGRKQMLRRIGLIVLLVVAAFFLTKTPEEQLHFFTYGLFGWLLAWSFEDKPVCLFQSLLLIWLAGTGDELIQALLPSRVFDLRDILFNGIAGTAGIAVFNTGSLPLL
jgi:hypothetical protein